METNGQRAAMVRRLRRWHWLGPLIVGGALIAFSACLLVVMNFDFGLFFIIGMIGLAIGNAAICVCYARFDSQVWNKSGIKWIKLPPEPTEKPKIVDPVSALKAGICSLSLNRSGFRTAIKNTVSRPFAQILEQYDAYQNAIAAEDFENAYRALKMLFAPTRVPQSIVTLRELYQLNDQVVRKEIGWLFRKRKPSQAELLNLSINYFILGESAGLISAVSKLQDSEQGNQDNALVIGKIFDLLTESGVISGDLWVFFVDRQRAIILHSGSALKPIDLL